MHRALIISRHVYPPSGARARRHSFASKSHSKYLVVSGLLHRGKLLKRLGDNVEALSQLILGDDQGWRETNDVAVCGLGLQNTISIRVE